MILKSGQLPQDIVHMDDHPLLTEECYLPTHGIEAFCNAAIRLLRSRRPGLAMLGNPRVGKTYAIEYFQKNHADFLGSEIGVYHMESWTEGPKTYSTEARFFGSVLKAVGYDLPFSGTAAVRLDRAVDIILESTRKPNDSRALLVVDEGQNLGKREYGYLMDLFNPLRRQGCRLKVMIIGQLDLDAKIAEMAKYPQIRARFHTFIREFPGYREKSQLRRVLECIDNTAFFPEESGWSYTYFFLPVAYNAGFRMADQLELLWSSLSIHCKDRGEISLQNVMDVVTELLVELSSCDNKNLDVDESLVNAICQDLAATRRDAAESAS